MCYVMEWKQYEFAYLCDKTGACGGCEPAVAL